MASKKESKAEIFAREYAKDLNATKAAIRAGYSPKSAASQASRLLRNVKMQEKVNAELTVNAERCQLDADYVLNGIRDTVEECRQEHNAVGALKGYELLGKHLKLFTEKIDVTDLTKSVEGRSIDDLIFWRANNCWPEEAKSVGNA